MTNYIVTTGRSLLTNLGHGVGHADVVKDQLALDLNEFRASPDFDSVAWKRVEAYLNRRNLVERMLNTGVGLSSNPLSAFSAKIVGTGLLTELHLPDEWKLEGLSAETETLLTGSRPLREDTIQLICSDTPDGKLAAILLGWLVAQTVTFETVGEHPPVQTPRTQSMSGLGLLVDEVNVRVVQYLNARADVAFADAVGALGHTMNRSVKSAGANIVLLSGGYKALPPYLVACCEYLAASGGRRDVKVRMKHEDADTTLSIALRKPPDGWREALSSFDRGHPLSGWAYDADRRELLEFGRLLARLTPSERSAG